MTNNIRYDWQRVSPETLQELAQAASDHEDYSCPAAISELAKAVQKARWQAVVMEIDSPKIDVLTAAEEYYKTARPSMSHSIKAEDSALGKLYNLLHAAFGPKS